MPGSGDETLEAKAPPAQPFAIGAQVASRYRIVRRIAAGAMGEVFEAEDLVVGVPIAVKVLHAHLASSTHAVERLRREIAIARKVTHANVCRVHDVGEHEGRVFLTMELLSGETLAKRIERGSLARDERERIAAQLIAGLSALHAAGVIHRDLKPANIVLVGERVVITDFGLARAQAIEDRDHTAEGAILGTPSFMAPEQVQGREATTASDIYALGVVLYQLATGELPFSGDTAMAIATARLTQDPPRASSRSRDLPPGWDAAIARCLARAPGDRFARVEDVLKPPGDRFARVEDVKPVRRARRRRGLVVAAIVALAIVAVAVVLLTKRAKPTHTPPSDPRERVAYHLARFEPAAAMTILDRLIVDEPDDARLHHWLAQAQHNLGDTARAVRHMKLAYDKRIGLPEVERLRIERDRKWTDDDYAGALAIADQLDTLAPGHLEDGLDRADLQVAAGRRIDALATLAALRSTHGDDPRVDLMESNFVNETDQQLGWTLGERAAANARRLGATQHEAAALARMAWSDSNLGRLARAEEEAEAARRLFLDGGNRARIVNSLNTLAAVRFSRGKYREANSAVKAATELKASDVPGGYEANLAIGMALVGETEAADTLYATIATTHEDDIVAVFRGWVAELRGDLPRARSLLDTAHGKIERDNKFAFVFWAWRSGVVHGRQGNLGPARTDLEAAIAASGPAGMISIGTQARISLARIALLEGNARSAATLARQGLDEQREHGSVAGVGFGHAVLAEAQLAAGDRAAARSTLGQAATWRAEIQDPTELAALDRAAKLVGE